MSIRLYLSPIVGDGVSALTAWRPKIADLALLLGHSTMIPSNANGSPTFTWALAIARATDWTTADADSTLNKLFDSADLPDTIQTWADFKTYLQAHTVSQIPSARRTTLNNMLTSHGIDTSSITLATTWWQVMVGVVKFLNGGVLPTSEMGIA